MNDINDINNFFHENGYLVVKDFLDKKLCNFAKVYFKIKQDTLDYDIDVQCPESKSFYGDIFCETHVEHCGSAQVQRDGV